MINKKTFTLKQVERRLEFHSIPQKESTPIAEDSFKMDI